MAKITMFAFDSLTEKRFNRYHLEDFLEQAYCTIDVWNKLKSDLDKMSYNYTTNKKQKITFQVGRIENPIIGTNFVIIWGYGLNDNDVNEKDFITYVNEICKKGVPVINKDLDIQKPKMKTLKTDTQPREARMKELEDLHFFMDGDTYKRTTYKKMVTDENGFSNYDTVVFDRDKKTLLVHFMGVGSELTEELKIAIYDKAKFMGITKDTPIEIKRGY